MQELRLVGGSEDGSAVLLVDDSGAKYRLSVDDRLRVLVRRPAPPPAASGSTSPRPAPALSPREIQARIRAGESAEDVAAVTGLPVEKVRRYEGPVLAERAHVAASAARSGVRRSTGEPGSADGASALGEAVTARMASRGVADDELRWDAWRREDARWTVRVDFPSLEGHTSAEFVFDLMSRYSAPAGAGARWLLGEDPAPPEQVRQLVPRLAAVGAESGWPERSQHPSLRNRSERPERPEPTSRPNAAAKTAAPLPTPAAAVASPPAPAPDPVQAPNPGLTPLSAPAPAPTSTPAKPPAEEPGTPPAAPAALTPTTSSDTAQPAPPAAGGATEGKPAGRPGSAPARRKRAAVPAWDDILFGGRPAE